jgi:uncharacterized protein
VVVKVKVIPRASKSEVVGEMSDGTLQVRVAAAPEKGQANEAVCRLLAAHFGVGRAAVSVAAGATGTRKLIRIEE